MRCSRFRALLRGGFDESDVENPEYEAVSRHERACDGCGDYALRRQMKLRGVSPAGQPCIHIADRLGYRCKDHPDPMDCPDAVLVYSPEFREWAIPVRDGPRARADSTIRITHCPWCGIELPRSLRYEWFDAMDAIGILDALFSRRVPEPYRTDAWWKADPARYGTMRGRRRRPSSRRSRG